MKELVNTLPWYDLHTKVPVKLVTVGLIGSAGLRAGQNPNLSFSGEQTWWGSPRGEFNDAAARHISRLSHLRALNMSNCRQFAITDAAFSHFSGLHTLDMSKNRRWAFTDRAFPH